MSLKETLNRIFNPPPSPEEQTLDQNLGSAIAKIRAESTILQDAQNDVDRLCNGSARIRFYIGRLPVGKRDERVVEDSFVISVQGDKIDLNHEKIYFTDGRDW